MLRAGRDLNSRVDGSHSSDLLRERSKRFVNTDERLFNISFPFAAWVHSGVLISPCNGGWYPQCNPSLSS